MAALVPNSQLCFCGAVAMAQGMGKDVECGGQQISVLSSDVRDKSTQQLGLAGVAIKLNWLQEHYLNFLQSQSNRGGRCKMIDSSRWTRSHVDGSKYGNITWHSLHPWHIIIIRMLWDDARPAISWLLDHYWLQTGSRVTRSTWEKQIDSSSTTNISYVHLNTKIYFSTPKLFCSLGTSWEPVMSMRMKWENQKY